ncbi:MAG: type II secretion system protein [Coriobacteriia bacterium]|nr:type II secretion system protein [Coriobacteriia bacterium]
MEREEHWPTCDSGFTLAELMTIVLIIGILVSIAVAVYVPATQSAASIACKYNQRVLEDAYVQAVTAENGASPTDIDDLAPYVNNLDRVKVCPLDGAELELDTDTGEISCPHPEHN